MQPRLLKTSIAQYEKQFFTGKNECGYHPIGDRILVLPDQGAQKTAGNVFIADETQERHSMAAESGVIIEVGEGAWRWNADRTREFEGRRPVPGDRVCFERYAGQLIMGDDGKMYRMMDDKCIGGIEHQTGLTINSRMSVHAGDGASITSISHPIIDRDLGDETPGC